MAAGQPSAAGPRMASPTGLVVSGYHWGGRHDWLCACTTNQVGLGLFTSCFLGPRTVTGVLSHCHFCHVVLAKTNVSKPRKKDITYVVGGKVTLQKGMDTEMK